jgi:hypothetical protein
LAPRGSSCVPLWHKSGSYADYPGFAAVRDVKLLEQACNVEFDGALADSEFVGDRAVPLANREMCENFEFARIQGGKEMLVRSGRRQV